MKFFGDSVQIYRCTKLFIIAIDGYVVKLTDVTASPGKAKYFNAVLHDGNTTKTLVSYNEKLHATLDAAKAKDKPVQINQFYESFDEFRGCKILKLSENSTVQYSSKDIPFEVVQPHLAEVNKMTKIETIQDSIAINENVNLLAHASLSSPIEDVTTQFGLKKKRNVDLQDDTGNIQLALWNKHIDYVKESGLYKFKDLRLKSFNGKYLTTTALTVIAKANEEVAFPVKIDLNDSCQAEVDMPPIMVEALEENYFCKKCNFKAVPCGEVIVCERCCSKSLLRIADRKFFMRALFAKDDLQFSISISHAVIMKYLASLDNVPSDKNGKELAFLTCKNKKLVYSTNTFNAIDILDIKA